MEYIRYRIFWIFDFLRGSKVLKHYKEVKFVMENPGSSRAKELHAHNLRQLLKHVVKQCDYYSKNAGSLELSSFPVVNKSIIKNNQNRFKVQELSEKSFEVTTSGSTGTPFRSYQNQNKKYRNNADTIYFAERAGYKVGHRLIYMKIWVKQKMRNKLAYWAQNIVPIDVIQFNEKDIARLLNAIRKNSCTYGILAYSSVLDLMCTHLEREDKSYSHVAVNSIIAISEALTDHTKLVMEKYFEVPVVSRYSNLENGILAQQEVNGSKGFLINTASYHIEILKMDSDEPAHEGEMGRIVVTDYFNYLMPFIRYDTGDIGALQTDPTTPGLKYLSVVEGRKLDLLYDTSGELVSSYIVYKNMWQYPEIDQYQLIQERAKEYCFKINVKGAFLKEKQLVEEFKTFLGTDALLNVEYVDEIPLLASGKRRKIVNNYKNY
ncbi:hypothetical protein [Carboxylicivirga sp. 1411-1]|uniref:hypothetical protein n=1 Tax=Carboxylicivirga sp. 1411-1 TaxID=3417573 RepID=UPI003D33A30E